VYKDNTMIVVGVYVYVYVYVYVCVCVNMKMMRTNENSVDVGRLLPCSTDTGWLKLTKRKKERKKNEKRS